MKIDILKFIKKYILSVCSKKSATKTSYLYDGKKVGVYVHDFKYVAYKGNIYGPPQFQYETLWKEKYLNGFDELIVVARGQNSNEEESIKELVRIDGDRVSFISTRSLASIRNIIYLPSVMYEIAKVTNQASIVYIRLPSIQGLVAASILRRSNINYITEVVGNGFESYWHHGKLIGKFLALPYHLLNLHAVKKSQNVLYVTNKYLQEVYPNNYNNIFCSSVKLSTASNLPLKKRIDKINSYTKSSTIRLGLVGPYDVAYKGHIYALKALKSLLYQGYNVELHFLGSGSSKKINRTINKLGIEPYVRVVGSKRSGKEMFHWLDSIDILLIPSDTEGLPRVMLESMARGGLIIASDAGDMPHVLDKEYIVNPKNIRQLSSKIIDLLSSSKKMIDVATKNFLESKNYDYKLQLYKRNIYIQSIVQKNGIKQDQRQSIKGTGGSNHCRDNTRSLVNDYH